MTYLDEPGQIPVILASLRDRATKMAPDPIDPEAEPAPPPPPPSSVAMTRNDAAPPLDIGSPAAGLFETGRTSYDLIGTLISGDAGGEYSLGAVDANNRFRIYVNGTALQVARIAGGSEPLIGTAGIPNDQAGAKLRMRIVTEDDKAHLSVFLGSTRVYHGGPFAAFPGGTKSAWRNDARPVSTDVQVADPADPIAILGTDFLSTSNLRATIDVAYTTLASQPAPTGLRIRQTDLNGATLVDWEDARIVSYSGPGLAKIVAPTPYSGPLGMLAILDVEMKAVPSIKAKSDLYYPEPLRIGQNVTGISSVFRSMRTFTNMMQQGYWQNNGAYGHFDTYGRNSPGVLDEMGWPLRENLWFWYPLPDQLTTQTYILKWTGGDMSVSHFPVGEAGGVVEQEPMIRVDANTITWRMRGDRRVASGGPHGRFNITAIDPANPPKNMQLYLEGEDISQRFLPSFIDFMKTLPDGWLRFLDDRDVNGEAFRLGKPWIWANRPKQDNGTSGVMAIEDMVEICVRAGRGLLYQPHSSYAYEEGGLDFYDREIDVIYGQTPGEYSTPGFSAPNGVTKTVAPEIDNEVWGEGNFGAGGSYHYQYGAANRYGILPPFNVNDGAAQVGAVAAMRCINQKTLMQRLQSRIPNWRARTMRILGVQMGGSDLYNLTNSGYWDQAKDCIDYIFCAPYIPNDPTSGGQAANLPDRSPPGICAFLAKSVVDNVQPTVVAQAKLIARLGYKPGVYEVNVSIPSLGLTIEENFALQKSPDYYQVWQNSVIAMLQRVGGYQHLYSDVGPILPPGQQWSLMHIPFTDYNQSWDAVVDWSAANS